MQAWQYIALIGAVVAVAAVVLPKRKGEQKNASSGAQMEQFELAFEQFMDNMEQEQKDLVKMLTNSLQQMREEQRIKGEIITRLEQKNEALEEQMVKLSNQIAGAEAKLQILVSNPESLPLHRTESKSLEGGGNAVESPQAQQEKPVPADSIYARYTELFDMYNAGKSVEVIAKKLGKNKGEVQLILQLAMQEEKSRHA